MQKKTLQFKITKTRMNIANLINTYANIYTYIIWGKNDLK